jgi:putative sigma-54 modulation protein
MRPDRCAAEPKHNSFRGLTRQADASAAQTIHPDKELCMQLSVQGHGMPVDGKLGEHIQKRSVRLDRYLPGAEELRVEFKRNNAKEDAPRTVQLTVKRKRAILRVEEHHADPKEAFDAAMDKLYHRIARYKGKHMDRKHNKHAHDDELNTAEALPNEIDASPIEDTKVVRIKSFSVVPMSVEEAVEQMELVGHDFYVFMHEKDDTVKVVYRRKQEDYGLLQPEK